MNKLKNSLDSNTDSNTDKFKVLLKQAELQGLTQKRPAGLFPKTITTYDFNSSDCIDATLEIRAFIDKMPK